MTDTQESLSLDLVSLAERLESIESLLFALHSNASYLEYEPFEQGLPLETLASDLENFIDGLGLQHFSGRELTPYWSKTRGNARNSAPPQNLWNNLARTLKVLDQLRSDLGVPITITSSYRDADYNAAVGGVPNSEHTKGLAIDFVARGGNSTQWGNKLKTYRGRTFSLPSIGNFVFHGGIGIYVSRNFVHLDTRGTDANWVE
jgi:N-acetylmuramoyl-L-alanine amidase